MKAPCECDAHVEVYERNRRAWDAASDAYQAQHAAQLQRNPMAWGVWSLPESELQLLGDVAGRDILEYGCGAAAWSIALAQRGARVTGLDNSAQQLSHASRAAAAAAVTVAFVHAPGEATPFAAASFDLVFCDHGAMSFAPPERTVPEVARLLRTGGCFVFCIEHPVHATCWDDAADAPSRGLQRSYFALDRCENPRDGAVSFARPIGAYVALFEAHGLQLERLVEPRPPAGAATTYAHFAPPDWARNFPAELILRARRR